MVWALQELPRRQPCAPQSAHCVHCIEDESLFAECITKGAVVCVVSGAESIKKIASVSVDISLCNNGDWRYRTHQLVFLGLVECMGLCHRITETIKLSGVRRIAHGFEWRFIKEVVLYNIGVHRGA
jgi:hypothetical protein